MTCDNPCCKGWGCAVTVVEPEPIVEPVPHKPKEHELLKEFFFGKQSDPASIIQSGWKAEGRCPECGEKGRYHLSTPVCPFHGPY